MEIWGTGWQAKYILFLWTIRKIIIIQQILCILPLCAIFHPKGSQRDLSLIPFFSFQKITCQPLTILFHTVQYILKFATSLFILMKLPMCICLWGFFSSDLGFHAVLINRHLCSNTSQILLINHTFLLHCRHFVNLLLKYWRWLENFSHAIRKLIKSSFERICMETKSQFSWRKLGKWEVRIPFLMNTFFKKLNFWSKCLLDKQSSFTLIIHYTGKHDLQDDIRVQYHNIFFHDRSTDWFVRYTPQQLPETEDVSKNRRNIFNTQKHFADF